MIQDDWLLRQLAELAEALAGVRTEIAEEQLDLAADGLDALARESVGLSLAALDRLPLPAVIGAASAWPEDRRQALSAILEVASEAADRSGDEALAEARRAKGRAISG